jgi:cell wall-associated NlpC family hydrolase
VIAGLALFANACGESSPEPVTTTTSISSAPAAGVPPHPDHLDIATPAQERKARDAGSGRSHSVYDSVPKPTVSIKDLSPEEMPAASAGTNGSFTPRPASERRSISVQTAPGSQSHDTAILLGRTALAPPNAPEAVQAAISGANQIVGTPYVWGGGHGSWYSAGYDCSGSVSYALGAAGLLGAPLTSGQLASWGEPGPGRWITVYANASHTYAVIAGLRWDTVGDARGTGPRWHAELPYPKGYVVRHPPGY